MISEKIVVVDDDPRVLENLQVWFPEYEFLYFSDGEKAIHFFKKPNAINLALIDFKMPGIDGISVLQEIRKNNKHLDVIFITAYGSMDLAIEIAGPGGTATWNGAVADGGWIPVVIELLPEDWAVTGSWTEILQDVTLFSIQFDFGNGFVGVDNVSLSNVEVPTASTWGLVVLTGFLMIAGTCILRRQKDAKSPTS